MNGKKTCQLFQLQKMYLGFEIFTLWEKYCPCFYKVKVFFYLASDLVKKRFYTRGTLRGIRILELARIRFLYRNLIKEKGLLFELHKRKGGFERHSLIR